MVSEGLATSADYLEGWADYSVVTYFLAAARTISTILLGGLNGGLPGLGGLGDIDLLLGDDIFASLGLPILDQGLLDLNGVLGNGGLDISSLSNTETSFADSLPASNGHRYAVPVRPMRFDPEDDTTAPTTAPLPSLQVEHRSGEQTSVGNNYVFDTGAQMSIISTETPAS